MAVLRDWTLAFIRRFLFFFLSLDQKILNLGGVSCALPYLLSLLAVLFTYTDCIIAYSGVSVSWAGHFVVYPFGDSAGETSSHARTFVPRPRTPSADDDLYCLNTTLTGISPRMLPGRVMFRALGHWTLHHHAPDSEVGVVVLTSLYLGGYR